MPDEEWRDVRGYEGSYQVSDLGRVRSLDRTYIRKGFLIPVRGRVLKANAAESRSGHLMVSLYLNGKPTSYYVHRLVCQAFHGDAPEGKTFVLHWDDNPVNNRASNLRWGTALENASDLLRNGKHFDANKTHCPSGHAYTEENTYRHPSRSLRVCLTCRKNGQYRRRREGLSESDPRHGTISGYNSNGCRCDKCTKVASEYRRKYRSR